MADFIRSASTYSSSQVDPDVFGLMASATSVTRQNDAANKRLLENIARYQEASLIADLREKEAQAERKSLGRAAALGQIDPTEGVIKRPTAQGFIWDNYSNGKESVSITSQSENTRAWLGYNAYAFGQQMAGLSDNLDQINDLGLNTGEIGSFREEMGKLGVDLESGWGIGRAGVETFKGAIAHWITGADSGAMMFTEGGSVYNALHAESKDWTTNGGREAAASALLDPETPVGQMYLEMGLRESDILETRNAVELAFILNQREHQYVAGQTTAHFGTLESVWQMGKDLGIGFVTDPDSVVEIGVTAAVAVATGGLGVVGGLVSGGGRLALAGAKAGRLAGAARLFNAGATKLANGIKLSQMALKAPSKLLPSAIFSEAVIPMAKNLRFIKNAQKVGRKTGDEGLEFAGSLLEELHQEGNTSIILDALARTIHGENAGDLISTLAGGGMDGFVGELAAYALSQDEIYQYQRFVNGSSVNRSDFDTTLGGYIESGLTGFGFGAALGGALSIGAGSISHVGGFVQFMGENYNPEYGFNNLFADYKASVKEAKTNSLKQDVYSRLSDLTGSGKLEASKSFFTERMKANGASRADIENAHKMLDYAYAAGVEMETLISKVGGDLSRLAQMINQLENGDRAAARRLAFDRINSLRTDEAGRKALTEAYDLSLAINKGRVASALKNNTKITDVNTLEIIKDIAANKGPNQKAAKALMSKLQKKARKENLKVLSILGDSGLLDLSADVRLDIINKGLEGSGRKLTKDQLDAISLAMSKYDVDLAALDETIKAGLARNSGNARREFMGIKKKLEDKNLSPAKREELLGLLKLRREEFAELRRQEAEDARASAAAAGGTLEGPLAVPAPEKVGYEMRAELRAKLLDDISEAMGMSDDVDIADPADIIGAGGADASVISTTLSSMIKAMSKSPEDEANLRAMFGPEFNDARNDGATYSVKNMLEETKKNLAKLETIDADLSEASRLVALDEITGEDGKLMTSRVIAQKIQDRFGVDVGTKVRNEAGEVVSTLPVDEAEGELQAVYAELYTSLAQIDELGKHPDAYAVLGRTSERDLEIAESLFDSIVQLEKDAAEAGFDLNAVPLEFVRRYFPPGLENLMTNVFEKVAGTRVRTDLGPTIAFSVSAMKNEASVRLARAGEVRARVELHNVHKQLSEGTERFDAVIRNRELNSTSLEANRHAYESSLAEEVRTNPETLALRDLIMEEEGFANIGELHASRKPKIIRGLIDAWSQIPDGTAKVRFGKELGIDALLRRNNDVFKPRESVRKTNQAEVDIVSDELFTKIDDYLRNNYGIGLFDLVDGQADIVDGYTAGRAAIEALAPHRDVGTSVGDAYDTKSATEGKVMRRGYLGSMSSKSLASVHEASVKQNVVNYILFNNDGDIRDVREFTDADVETTYKWYDEIESEIKRLDDLGWPEAETKAFFDKYVQNTMYEPFRDRTFAPTRTIRQIREEIGNFRTMVARRTEAIANGNPAIIKTLHDEVAGPRSFLGSMFIVGNVPDAADSFVKGVTADFGLSGAVVTPGSFKQAWQIRTSNMFGSVKGVADIAALAGAKELSKFITSLGENRAQFLRTLATLEAGGVEYKVDGKVLEITNDRDASAQAVTAAQSIWKDFLATHDVEALPDVQREFNKFMAKVTQAARNDWGGKAMLDQLEEYSNFTSEKGVDNYSIVGKQALKELGATDKGWGAILQAAMRNSPLSEKSTPEEKEALTLKDLGPVGAFLRKEIFKRPVMTLPYSAGERAFKNAIRSGLEQLKRDYAMHGLTKAEADAINPTKMASAMASALYSGEGLKAKEGVDAGTGLIEQMLGIPKSEANLAAIQKQGTLKYSRNVDGDVVVAEITPAAVANGTWLNDADARTAVIDRAKRMFGIDDEATAIMMGEWLLKMQIEHKNGTITKPQLEARIKAAKKFASLGPGEKAKWDAVSSYMATAEHTGRMGFLADADAVDDMRTVTGLEVEDLSPEAAAQLMGVAAYFPKATGFSRAFSGMDAAEGVRDKSGATKGAEITGVGETQVGQYDLADGLEGLGGRNAEEWAAATPEERRAMVEKAVLQDSIIEASGIFKPPPGLEGADSYVEETPGEFLMRTRSPESREANARQSKVIEEGEARYAELKKKHIANRDNPDKPENEPLTEAEMDEFNRLEQVKKILLSRDEDGRLQTINNDKFLAADRKAEQRIDNPDPRNKGDNPETVMPTKAGVPVLRAIRSLRDSGEHHVRGLSEPNAFSVSELAVASPYSPEWLARTGEDAPTVEALSSEQRGQEISSIRETSPAILEAELRGERARAEAQGIGVTELRAETLTKRARQNRATQRALAARANAKTEAEIEKANQAINAAVIDALLGLEESMEVTFGGMGEADAADRGSFNIFEIDDSGSVIPGSARAETPLQALQMYARMNHLGRHVGLALGPVNTPGLRIVNPKVDEGVTTPEPGETVDFSKGKSNEVSKVTSRGPYSIFSRDWAIMGGSHIDAVNNMIDLMAEQMIDPATGGAGGRAFVLEQIKSKGFFETYADFTRTQMGRMGEEAYLNYVGRFTSMNLDGKKGTMSPDTARILDAEFDEQFERGIVNHGLNPRIAVVLDGEEKMVLLEMIESLSDPANLAYFRKMTGLKDATPVEIAVAFAHPDTQKKVAFLKPYEEVKVWDEEKGTFTYETQYQTFGDIVNSIEMVDPKLQRDARPVYTEMGMLNMFNMTGNREFMRKFMLANMFGVDLAGQLTNSRMLDSKGGNKWQGARAPNHGFAGQPKSKADAQARVDAEGWGGGFKATAFGALIRTRYELKDDLKFRQRNKEGKFEEKVVRDQAYGIAEVLLSHGLITRNADGKMSIVNGQDNFPHVWEAIKKMQPEGEDVTLTSEIFKAAEAIHRKRQEFGRKIKEAKESHRAATSSKKSIEALKADVREKMNRYSKVLQELSIEEYVYRRDKWRAENPGTRDDMTTRDQLAAYSSFVIEDSRRGLRPFSREYDPASGLIGTADVGEFTPPVVAAPPKPKAAPVNPLAIRQKTLKKLKEIGADIEEVNARRQAIVNTIGMPLDPSVVKSDGDLGLTRPLVTMDNDQLGRALIHSRSEKTDGYLTAVGSSITISGKDVKVNPVVTFVSPEMVVLEMAARQGIDSSNLQKVLDDRDDLSARVINLNNEIGNYEVGSEKYNEAKAERAKVAEDLQEANARVEQETLALESEIVIEDFTFAEEIKPETPDDSSEVEFGFEEPEAPEAEGAALPPEGDFAFEPPEEGAPEFGFEPPEEAAPEFGFEAPDEAPAAAEPTVGGKTRSDIESMKDKELKDLLKSEDVPGRSKLKTVAERRAKALELLEAKSRESEIETAPAEAPAPVTTPDAAEEAAMFGFEPPEEGAAPEFGFEPPDDAAGVDPEIAAAADRVAHLITPDGDIRVPKIQTELGVGFSRATKIKAELERRGLLKPAEPTPDIPTFEAGPGITNSLNDPGLQHLVKSKATWASKIIAGEDTPYTQADSPATIPPDMEHVINVAKLLGVAEVTPEFYKDAVFNRLGKKAEEDKPSIIEFEFEAPDDAAETAIAVSDPDKSFHEKPFSNRDYGNQPGRTDVGRVYVATLDLMYEETGDIMYANQANLFRHLTDPRQETSIGEDEAISLMEWAVTDDEMRRALYGGGPIQWEDGGSVSVDIDYSDPNKIRTRLNGLATVKRLAGQDRLPAAGYLLIHELVERMLSNVRNVELPSTARGLDKGGLITRIKNNMIKDLIDTDGWSSFLEFCRGIGIENMDHPNSPLVKVRKELMTQIGEAEEAGEIMAAVDGKQKPVKVRSSTNSGRIEKLTKNVVTAIGKVLQAQTKHTKKPSVRDLNNREATTELMAQWLTVVAFRQRRIDEPLLGGEVEVATHLLGKLQNFVTALSDRIVNGKRHSGKDIKDKTSPRMRALEGVRTGDKRFDMAREGNIAKPGTPEGDAYANTAGAVTFAPTESSMFGGMQKVMRDLATKANEIYDHQELGRIGSVHKKEVQRSFGGDLTSSIDNVRNAIDKAVAERSTLEAGSGDWWAKDKEIRELRSALAGLDATEAHMAKDDMEGSFIRARTNDEGGLDDIADLRRVSPADRQSVIDYGTDETLGKFVVKQDNITVNAIKTLGTMFSSADAFVSAGGSKNFAIRGLMAMLDPSSINTQEVPAGYIPAQFSNDHIQTQFAHIRNILSPVRKAFAKLEKDGPANANKNTEIQRKALAYVETGKEDLLIGLELPESAKNALKSFREAMFEPKKGLYHQIVNIAEQDGVISSSEANNLRKHPRLPYQLDRAIMDDQVVFQQVRTNVAGAMRNRQIALLSRDKPEVDYDMAVDTGILFSDDLTDSQKQMIVNSMPPQAIKAFEEIFNDMVKLGYEIPPGFDKLERWQKIALTQQLIKENMFAKDKSKAPGKFNIWTNPGGKSLVKLMTTALANNKVPEWAQIPNGSGSKLTPAQHRMTRVEQDNQRKSHGYISERPKEDPGIGGFRAHRIVETWRNGGNLKTSYRLLSDPRTPEGQAALTAANGGTKPDWLNYQVNNLNTMTNSLFGSRVMESFFNVANQNVTKVKGLGVTSMISSIRSRVLNNEPIPVGKNEDGTIQYAVLNKTQADAALRDLDDIENQYRVNMGRTPKGMKEPTNNQRRLLAATRLGTTVVSAPQWALSTVAETTGLFVQGVLRTLFKGDLKAFMDFLTPLGKGARKELYRSVNLFHNQYDRHNIGIKTGQYFLDQMADLDTKRGEQLFLEKLDGTLRSFGTVGFGKMTRYNRYVMAARSVRKLKKAAKKPGFGTFLDEVAGKQMSVKEVVAAGRKAGISKDVAYFLATAGVGDKTNGRAIGQILNDFTDDYGVKWESVNEAIQTAQERGDLEMATSLMKASQAVSGMLQAMNTTINVEPRMGTKAIPKTVADQVLASLTQFPVLAMHNIGRMARVGGLGGAMSYLLYLLLGDSAYEHLKEVMVKGKSPEQVALEWETDPVGKVLGVLGKGMYLGGGFGHMVQNGIMYLAAEGLNKIDPTFAAGYLKESRNLSGGAANAAGVSMMMNAYKDLKDSFLQALDGEYEQAGVTALGISPLPMRPLVQFVLQQMMGENAYQHALNGKGSHSSSGQGSPRRSLSSRRGMSTESVSGNYDETNMGAFAKEAAQDARMAPEPSQASVVPSAPSSPGAAPEASPAPQEPVAQRAEDQGFFGAKAKEASQLKEYLSSHSKDQSDLNDMM